MFYSYDILNPRSGRLSIVWLAANKKLKFKTRQDRDFRSAMNVVVHRTCEEILTYIVRRKPIHMHEKKPRLSLYLSSMLMYGTVTVFRCQVNFLLYDAMDAYKRLLKKAALFADLLDVDIPIGVRVTMREPETICPLGFGTFEDFADLMPPLPLDINIPLKNGINVTPRKSKDTRTTLSPRPELRTEEGEGESAIYHLLGDWGEVTPIKNGSSRELEMPSRARLDEITLREDPLLTPAQRMQTVDVGPLVVEDLGPPFSLLPDQPFISDGRTEMTSDEVLAKKDGKEPGREEKAGESEELPKRIEEVKGQISEKEGESGEKTVEDKSKEAERSTVLEEPEHGKALTEIEQDKDAGKEVREGEITPHMPTVPEEAKKKKAKAPPQTIDHTLDEEQEQRRSRIVQDAPSQIKLFPVQKQQRRGRKRALKLIDAEIKMSKEELQRNVQVYHDTMRTKTPSEDIMHVKWWKLMHSSDTLLHKVTHRSALANSLKKILCRHYKSSAANEHYDFEPVAMRHPRLDQSEEPSLQRQADVTGEMRLSDVSALTMSKGDSSKSLCTPHVSFGDSLHVPHHIQEGTQLGAIQEEQAVVLDMKNGLENEIHEEIKRLESNQAMEIQNLPREGDDARMKTPPGAVDISTTAKTTDTGSPGSSALLPSIKVSKETDVVDKSAKEKDAIKGKRKGTEGHQEVDEKHLVKKRKRHLEPEPKEKLPEIESSVTQGKVDVRSWPGIDRREGSEDRVRKINVELSEEFCIFQQNIGGFMETAAEVPIATEGTFVQPQEMFDTTKEVSYIHAPSYDEVLSEKKQPFITAQEVLSDVEHKCVDVQSVTFDDLLDPKATRLKAAAIFSCLLELHKQCKVHLSQSINYGAISIEILE